MGDKTICFGRMLTPKESYVYSKLVFRPPYDSFGVEHRFEHYIFYKHAILSGLFFAKSLYDNY